MSLTNTKPKLKLCRCTVNPERLKLLRISLTAHLQLWLNKLWRKFLLLKETVSTDDEETGNRSPDTQNTKVGSLAFSMYCGVCYNKLFILCIGFMKKCLKQTFSPCWDVELQIFYAWNMLMNFKTHVTDCVGRLPFVCIGMLAAVSYVLSFIQMFICYSGMMESFCLASQYIECIIRWVKVIFVCFFSSLLLFFLCQFLFHLSFLTFYS